MEAIGAIGKNQNVQGQGQSGSASVQASGGASLTGHVGGASDMSTSGTLQATQDTSSLSDEAQDEASIRQQMLEDQVKNREERAKLDAEIAKKSGFFDK